MSTNFCIIKQDGQPPQNVVLTAINLALSCPQVHDQLLWPRDPHTGQLYTFEQLVAEASLPLPHSSITRLIQQRRAQSTAEHLPAEMLSPADIKQQESAQSARVCGPHYLAPRSSD